MKARYVDTTVSGESKKREGWNVQESNLRLEPSVELASNLNPKVEHPVVARMRIVSNYIVTVQRARAKRVSRGSYRRWFES